MLLERFLIGEPVSLDKYISISKSKRQLTLTCNNGQALSTDASTIDVTWITFAN